MNTTFKLYYLQTNITSLLILGMIFFLYSKSRKNTTEDRYFKNMLFCNMLYCISDMTAAFFKNGTFFGARTILYISNIIYIGIPLLMAIFWERYIRTRLRNSGFKKTTFDTIYRGIAIILCIATTSSPFTHFAFSLDELNHYNRTIGAYIVPVFALLYLVILTIKSIILGVKSNSNLIKKSTISISLFAVTPFICGILQTLFYGCTCNQIGFTFSMLLIFVTNQIHMISKDELTGLNNRSEYENYILSNIENIKSLYICAVDVNFFKKINETYGHLEGDLTLQHISEVLTAAAEKLNEHVFLARYGSDEFVFVQFNCNSDFGTRLEAAIQYELQMKNNQKIHQFDLAVSIEFISNDNIQSIEDVMKMMNETEEVIRKL